MSIVAERIIIIGGTRSGKSELAETLVAEAQHVVYVATGSDADAEMAERIAAHRDRRPVHWSTVDTLDPAGALRSAPHGAAVLIDALGAWVAARMAAENLFTDRRLAPLGEDGLAGRERILQGAADFWAAAGEHPGGPVVLVAEETGSGVTPMQAATRRFIDIIGAVTQQLTAESDRVLFAVGGRAVDLPPRPGGSSTVPTTADSPAAADTSDGGRLRAHGDRMVGEGMADFAVNVHGDAPPAHARAALDEATRALHRYPDDRSARETVAARHQRPVADTLITAGAAEAFWLLARVVAARNAVCVHPSFTEPEAALRAAGVPVAHVARRAAEGWRLDPSAVPSDADLVVVGNPNNPTGTLDAADTLAELCQPGRLTVVDEAFMDFVADDAASLAPRGDLPGLVVVRSVTKLWGLAGVRAGYLLAPQGLVARLAAARQPWPVSGPALAALTACLADDGYRRRVAGEVAAERARLAEDLGALPGVRVADSAANFLLVGVPDGPGVHAGLQRRGVAVRPSTFPGLGDDHLRVTVRDGRRNRQLVDALAATLESLR